MADTSLVNEQITDVAVPEPTSNAPEELESANTANDGDGDGNGDGEQGQDDDILSKKVTLADLTAKATAMYARKEWEQASETFALAAEMQSQINGADIHPDNAEILFLYGRSLFKVAQQNSQVLGAKTANENEGQPAPTASVSTAKPANGSSNTEKMVEGGLASAAEKAAEKAASAEKEEAMENKGSLFQFEGDENLVGSDDDDEPNDDDEAEEPEDDMQAAHDSLELARLCLMQRLEQLEAEDGQTNDKGKDVAEGDSPSLRHIKERLADTHDLLAEVSLENERFSDAVNESRISLKYKKELYPPESEILAEAHFKLSLALESASLTAGQEDDGTGNARGSHDAKLLDEACSELEAAIASTKLKLQSKEKELAELPDNPEDREGSQEQVDDIKDMIKEMELRLAEMRKPPFDLKSAMENAAGEALRGLLGSVAGQSPAQAAARVEEAKKTATDLTGLVRKKNKDEPHANGNGHESNGTKRKAEDSPEAEDTSKKARVAEEAA